MSKPLSVISAALLLACVLPLGRANAQRGSNVAETKHNLTATGPGPIRVAGQNEVCKFCHTPHSSNPIGPLWNRPDPGTYYQTYESSTLVANVGQPTGSSRLCLSCHDGTIALTETYNPRSAMQGSVYISPRDAGYIGTELRDDHPISFVYDSLLEARNGQLRDPSTLPAELPLDHNHELQCTTCHDPHDDTFGQFLRMDNRRSRMCTSCHGMHGWDISAHAVSNASLRVLGDEQWPQIPHGSVAEVACEACHRPHNAGGRERLLRFEAEEDNCFICHDGTVCKTDVKAQFSKFSRHPVSAFTGVHQPNEDPAAMPEHVECVDCHEPHQTATSGPSSAPMIKPSMKGASGLTSTLRPVAEATYEYEVCFKCHTHTAPFALPLVNRVASNADVSEQFSPGNASFHPVETQGRNMDVPSLVSPLNVASLIYCTDCHGSDDSRVKGPHGSAYRPMLVRDYEVTDGTSESPQTFALCYGCHNRASILGDQSFPLHRKHVVEEHAPCAICHDAHGISATQASPPNGTHLINFDRDVVLPVGGAAMPVFQDKGRFKGSCTLRCHGEVHDGKEYP